MVHPRGRAGLNLGMNNPPFLVLFYENARISTPNSVHLHFTPFLFEISEMRTYISEMTR